MAVNLKFISSGILTPRSFNLKQKINPVNLKFVSSFVVAMCRSYASKTPSKTLTGTKTRTPRKKLEPEKGSASADPDVEWTDEQSKILAAVANKKSVFITGSAGTGKTYLMNRVIEELKRVHGKGSVFVTATTGVAACALKGVTLHSFAGVGLGEGDKEDLLTRVSGKRRAVKNWTKAKALVIDEVSMLDGDLFDKLEYIARMTKTGAGGSVDGNGKLWGGIQLVVGGDFFQLPPVGVRGPEKKVFAFESHCWEASFDMQVELTKVFRQSDAMLVNLLQGIRRGKYDSDDMKLLKLCCFDKEADPSAVKLFPRIADVKKVNDQMLRDLKQEVVVYTAEDSGAETWKRMLDQGLAPKSVELSIGARVMLIKNVDVKSKLANGATGVVTGFTRLEQKRFACGCPMLPIVKFDSGMEMVVGAEDWEVMEGEKLLARRHQIPLVLAWAMSVHKCQGMTIDSLQADLSRAFDYGMVYVALSRVRSLSGLHLSGLKPSKIQAHPKVLEFYQSLSDRDCIQKKTESGGN